ncbi:BTAD domain-containing putative transcriptional regulator [Streptomyces sp. NPDC019937]|uniref:AfsR/SARP family transcriptional regulator n=1 Tax=Streptomyces sp. NPDC019937 TaxID=3154787 RepID=UPI0033D1B24C
MLEEMFEMPLEQLGFTLPSRRRSTAGSPTTSDSTVDARLPSEKAGVTGRPDKLPDDAGTRLRFAVLGPVRIWRGERARAALSPQEQALMCVLLLRQGRTATAEELVDAVWGETPPPEVIAGLRTYAFRLRRKLGPGVLVSEAGGYALRAGPKALDLEVCEERQAQAKHARAGGALSEARRLLCMALGLWDGQPLAGVPGPYAQAQRSRLEEWRLALLEARLELDLELGLHTEMVSELTALTAEHPLRERLRSMLMLALYRSGRQAEALGVYTDTRRLLADELGVDPDPELAQLHQRILHADPTLILQEHPSDVEAAHLSIPRPAQLPAGPADFTGRASAVNTLRARLLNAQGTVMAVFAVRGLGGVGKTALAVHVAHVVREHFPDGQLFVDLLGQSSRTADPTAVLGVFLRALGIPSSDLPEGLHERAALYRSTLANRRVLVVLDNAHDTRQVRPLLPGAPGCATLITSRTSMVGLDGVHLIDLDTMDPSEALALFTRIIGEERAATEPDSCREAVAACGYLPLAIRIAAARLASRPNWSVTMLTSRLADTQHRLQELRAGDLEVQTSFEFGYAQLEPAQARAFRLLALTYGPDISLAAAAATLDMDTRETEHLLEALVDTSLLNSTVPGRYRYHDLVRLYGRACADRDELKESRTAARSRLLDFYLASAAHAYAMGRPKDRLVDHLAPTHHLGQHFPDVGTALDWLFTEADCLLACAQQAAESSDKSAVCRAADLLLVTRDLAESGARSSQYVTAAQSVQKAAHIAGDTRAKSRAHLTLALLFPHAMGQEQADNEASLASDLATTIGDLTAACHASNMRGVIAIYQRRFEDAEGYFRDALHGFQTDGNLSGVASALCNLSRVRAATGHAESAIELATRGFNLWSSLGSVWRVGNARFALGIALHQAERHAEALHEFLEALAIFRDNRQRLWEGSTHARLAEVYLASDRPTEAAAHAEQALSMRSLGDKLRRGTILNLLGLALEKLGQIDRAHACWREALKMNLEKDQKEEIRARLQSREDA